MNSQKFSDWILQSSNYNVRYKLLRIPIGKQIPANMSKKRFMTDEEVNALFSNEVSIEEKIDGQQISKIHDGTVFYGEYLKYTHSIHYTKLPSYFICWETYNPKTDKYAWPFIRKEICDKYGIYTQTPLYVGKTTLSHALTFLERQSSFSDDIQEGIVIKNHDRQIFGKIVREEFINGIELKGHWMRQKGLAKQNIVRKDLYE